MPGQLRGEKVWVQDQAEGNRIYNKGRFGRPRSGGSLELDLVEAAYLLEKERLRLDGGEDGSIQQFYQTASKAQPDFLIRYLAYRELREKGLNVQLAGGAASAAGFHFVLEPPSTGPRTPATYVAAASERAPLPVKDLVRLADRCRTDRCLGMVTVVDEESDTTTYEVAFDEPRGRTPARAAVHAQATLQVDRCVVWDQAVAQRLHKAEFFGRLFSNGLHLSLVESLHLVRRGLRVQDAQDAKPLTEAQLAKLARKFEPGVEQRLRVFEDLKGRDLVVKTGYKFGTHFRAYEGDPDGSHAPWLVHSLAQDDVLEWPLVSRAVRLAHGVRKTLLLAIQEPKELRYVRLRRSR